MIKKHKALLAYMLVLAVFSVYVVLDSFVITRVYGDAAESGMQTDQQTGEDNDTQDHDSSVGTQDSASDKSADDALDSTPGGSADVPSKNAESKHAHKPGGPHGDDQSVGQSGGHEKTHSANGNASDGQKSSASQSSASSDFNVSSSNAAGSYSDDNISIELTDYSVSGTTVHVAEVKTGSAGCLKTALAKGQYGKNVTAATTDIADSVDAILAINGDYYGAQEKGYVIRNGTLYRDVSAGDREDLVIYKDGSFGIINESEVTAEDLVSKGAVQTLSFGPALVESGEVSVDAGDEVGRAMASNPRTAIGIKSDGTYIFMVSDGRTDESEGFSLLQLADMMEYLGAETAYNLDGGGSSTMVFKGSVVNTPTGGGIGNGSGSERKVSDIVYIGY